MKSIKFIFPLLLTTVIALGQNSKGIVLDKGIFETFTPSHHLLNLGVNLEAAGEHSPFEISTGVKNVLNTTYIDHLSRLKSINILNQGINFYIGLKVKINKELRG
jgi:outer membrane receptor protein involved in Fe transport